MPEDALAVFGIPASRFRKFAGRFRSALYYMAAFAATRIAFRACKCLRAKCGRRQAGLRLEGAVEGAQRLKTCIECNRGDRHIALVRIRQRLSDLGEAPLIEVGVEIAMAELPVDQAPQLVLGNAPLTASAAIDKFSSR